MICQSCLYGNQVKAQHCIACGTLLDKTLLEHNPSFYGIFSKAGGLYTLIAQSQTKETLFYSFKEIPQNPRSTYYMGIVQHPYFDASKVVVLEWFEVLWDDQENKWFLGYKLSLKPDEILLS